MNKIQQNDQKGQNGRKWLKWRKVTKSTESKSKPLKTCRILAYIYPRSKIEICIDFRSIIVRWNDAPIGHFLTNYNAALAFEYTIDITPCPANEFGLKSVLFKKDSGGSNGLKTPSVNDIESKSGPTGNNEEKSFRYEVAFDNIISQEEEYTVTISTELNGRTVTQMVEKFPMGQPEP